MDSRTHRWVEHQPLLGADGVTAQDMHIAWFVKKLDPARAYILPTNSD